MPLIPSWTSPSGGIGVRDLSVLVSLAEGESGGFQRQPAEELRGSGLCSQAGLMAAAPTAGLLVPGYLGAWFLVPLIFSVGQRGVDSTPAYMEMS